MNIRSIGSIGLILAASVLWAQGKGAYAPAQAAADVLRQVSGSDGAFINAGILKPSFNSEDLSTLMLYPTDEILVLRLKGSEIRQAFERSLSLYPQENTSFLQVSGFEIEFSTSGDPGKRVLNVKASGTDLDENRYYQVAMPAALGRGGSGYFKLWDKTKIVATVPNQTVESVLKGKRAVDSKPRWVSHS